MAAVEDERESRWSLINPATATFRRQKRRVRISFLVKQHSVRVSLRMKEVGRVVVKPTIILNRFGGFSYSCKRVWIGLF